MGEKIVTELPLKGRSQAGKGARGLVTPDRRRCLLPEFLQQVSVYRDGEETLQGSWVGPAGLTPGTACRSLPHLNYTGLSWVLQTCRPPNSAVPEANTPPWLPGRLT